MKFTLELRTILVALCAFALTVPMVGEVGAAFEGTVVDSRVTGMGDCLSASTRGALSLAPLPPSGTPGALSLSYCSPFGLEELAQKSVVCSISLQGNVVTLGLLERGGSLCKEGVLSISASGRLLESTSLSLSLGMFSMSVRGFEARRFFGLSAGARVRPARSLEACVGFDNVVTSRNEGTLPQTFLFGLLITPASNVTVAGEMRKSPGGLSSLHFGVELQPEAGIRLRCGLQTVPVELAVGLAIELGPLSLETASSFHPVLGRTNVLTLTWLGRRSS